MQLDNGVKRKAIGLVYICLMVYRFAIPARSRGSVITANQPTGYKRLSLGMWIWEFGDYYPHCHVCSGCVVGLNLAIELGYIRNEVQANMMGFNLLSGQAGLAGTDIIAGQAGLAGTDVIAGQAGLAGTDVIAGQAGLAGSEVKGDSRERWKSGEPCRTKKCYVHILQV